MRISSSSSRLFSFLNLALVFAVPAAPAQNYNYNARLGINTLQQWYNPSSGLWDTSRWWQSANCLTTLGDLAQLQVGVKHIAIGVFENTFARAQAISQATTKIIKANFMIESIPVAIESEPKTSQGFLNDFYDDEGWWALAWIQAYDMTRNQNYLNAAEIIFNDMANASTTPCGGGIWWDKNQTYVNAITNELFLSVAAHLANRVTKKKDFYVNVAQAHWRWFQGTGMLNTNNTIHDGLNAICASNNGTVWSYNQGVILGALVELNSACLDTDYITVAKAIARGAIRQLSDVHGVLHDVCEPDCGNDGGQFKGIFMRGLQMLQTASPEKDFLSYIAINANSIWNNDRNSQYQFSINWAGPFTGTANASTHSSAMDTLVAAAAFESELRNSIVST